MPWPRRSSSFWTSAGAIVRLGMSRSSASSTTAVLITTPGETPMPFLISMRISGQWSVASGQKEIHWPLTTHSVFAELLVEQLTELPNGFFGIFSGRFDLQWRALGGGEDDHLHHALAVGFARFLAALDHLDVALELVGQIDELHRRPRVQAKLVLNDDFARGLHKWPVASGQWSANPFWPLTTDHLPLISLGPPHPVVR